MDRDDETATALLALHHIPGRAELKRGVAFPPIHKASPTNNIQLQPPNPGLARREEPLPPFTKPSNRSNRNMHTRWKEHGETLAQLAVSVTPGTRKDTGRGDTQLTLKIHIVILKETYSTTVWPVASMPSARFQHWSEILLVKVYCWIFLNLVLLNRQPLSMLQFITWNRWELTL